ncbi:MAG: class I SAM-dependent methyltransferase [Clostridia bacterium]|nr:class I SAM-dependent methyltransferase [Clostridia bacterium]
MNGRKSNGFGFIGKCKSSTGDSNVNNQNIFDNDTFFNGYKDMRDNDINYNDLLEQPAMSKLLPDLKGKSVLDLGCGYGHNCIDFVNRGAARVVGIDISEKMLAVAKAESAHEKIEYLNMSMTDISSLDERFDLIYSSLAFHYVKDFDSFAKDMYSILNVGGHLLFSQEHPIITATVDGNGHFNKDKKGNRISYTFSDYNNPGERKIHWYVDGVVKYHRTVSGVINALAKAGFIIDEICEPVPEDWAIEKLPTIVKEYIKPNFLIVKSKK